MSITQEQNWITGAEFGTEWRRLVDEDVPDDDPRFRELFQRMHARDDYLYERYGLPLRDRYPGKWIAISLDGEVIILDRAGEVRAAANEAFGPGNAAIRRLTDPPFAGL